MLARIQKSLREKDAGFTLIELLVVMIIIGILAAIAVPVFLNQRKKGWDSQAQSDLRNIATAEETYFAENNNYALGTSVPAGAKTSSTVTFNSATGFKADGTAASTEADAVGGFCLKVTSKSNTVWYYNSKDGSGVSKTAC